MAREIIIFAILLILKLSGVFTLYITEAAESNNRQKRNIITLFPVIEEYAPEDLFKNAIDKVSERVKRSIETEGDTYGMRLTGGKGVVWNDFNDEVEVVFPDGAVSHKVIDRQHPNQYTLKDRINDREENRIETFYDGLDTSEQDLSTDISNVRKSITEEPRKEELYRLNTDRFNADDLKKSDKTYGMNLVGGHGSIWNDFHDKTIFYDVGKSQSNVVKKASNDDETINKQIQSFRNSLQKSKSRDNHKHRRPNLTTTTAIPINQKLNTVKPITETPVNRKPIAKKPSTKKPIAVQPTTKAPSIIKTSISEPNIEKLKSDLDKTYGMSITRGQGIVWNDLNGSRVLYHGGGDILVSPTFDTNENNIVTNDKNKNEESKEKVRPHLNIEKLVTNKPHLEQFDEKPTIYKPVIEEPKTNRPIFIGNAAEKTTYKPMIEASSIVKDNEQVKTYGMILTGDRGIVWNDLNGYRVSVHVGKPGDNLEEDDHRNLNTENDILAKSKDIDDNKSEYHLINEKGVYNDTNNILIEALEEFGKCVNDTSNIIDNGKIIDIVKKTLINETTKIKNEVKEWIRIEVTKQFEEYFTVHNEVKLTNNSNNNVTEIIDQKEENSDKMNSKKRKDCEKQDDKEPSSKIIANNIYGNTIGNGNVTNIFIFNISNGSNISRSPEEAKNNAGKLNENSEQPIENAEEPNKNPEKPNENAEEPVENTKVPNQNAEVVNENIEEPNKNSEELYENAVEPNENTEKPNENAEEPNDNIEELNKNAEEPNEDAEKPIEIAEEPNEKLEEPNENAEESKENSDEQIENTEEPNQNAEEPNENSEEPNEIKEQPNENAEEANKNTEELDENMVEPNENTEASKKDAEEQNDNLQEPHESAEEPNENSEEASENEEEPNKNAEEPYYDLEEPNENVENTDKNSEEPSENAEEPNPEEAN